MMGLFIVGIKIEIVVSPLGNTAQAIGIIVRFASESVARVIGKTISALPAHAGKVLEQSTFSAQTVDHILKLILKGFVLQVRLMIKPASPKFLSTIAKVTAKMTDAAAFQILLMVAGIKPIKLFCLKRFPDHILHSFPFRLLKDGLKRIQGRAGVFAKVFFLALQPIPAGKPLLLIE